MATDHGRELRSPALDARKGRRRHQRTRKGASVEQVVTDKGAAPRIARLVTEVLAPVVLIFVITLIVYLYAAGL